MIEGNDIICFSNDWDGDPLSKKHIALRLARKNRILWVNSLGNRAPSVNLRDGRRVLQKLWEYGRGVRQVADNIFVLPPLVIPIHGSRTARRLSRWLLAQRLKRACEKLGFRKPITYSFLPTSADVVGSVGERLIVYHCVDEYSEFTGASKEVILQMEHALMAKSDLVIVSSSRLYETKRGFHPNTFLVTHGVDVAHFRAACAPATTVPADCADLPHPVVGFFGLIADWVDLEVIRYLAVARPAWSFLLIGKAESDVGLLRGLTNVHLLGRRDYRTLPAYAKAMDVALLPFVRNELTMAANPLKLREYLAAGLPVVSTAIPEAKRLEPLLRTAGAPEEFLFQIEGLLAEGRRGPDLAVSRLMEHESWDGKVEELSRIITDVLAREDSPLGCGPASPVPVAA